MRPAWAHLASDAHPPSTPDVGSTRNLAKWSAAGVTGTLPLGIARPDGTVKPPTGDVVPAS